MLQLFEPLKLVPFSLAAILSSAHLGYADFLSRFATITCEAELRFECLVSSTILLRHQRKPTGLAIDPDRPNPVCLLPAKTGPTL